MKYETIDKSVLEAQGFKHVGFYGLSQLYVNNTHGLLLDKIKETNNYNIRFKYNKR